MGDIVRSKAGGCEESLLGTEATEARLETCQRGLGSYKNVRAVRPVNDPLLMTVMLLLYRYL